MFIEKQHRTLSAAMAVLVVITAIGMGGQRGPGAPRVPQAGPGMGQGLGAESKIQASAGRHGTIAL